MSIEKVWKAESFEETLKIGRHALLNEGYDTFLAGLPTREVAFFAPEGWRDEYGTNDYAARDPILKYAFKSRVPYLWDRIAHPSIITEAEQDFMSASVDAGIRHGISCPVSGPTGDLLFNVSLASSSIQREPEKLVAPFSTLINAIMQRHPLALPEREKEYVLTRRQREALQWAACGKTQEEISILMGITLRAVIKHFSDVRGRLGAANVTEAVVRGLVLKEIELDDRLGQFHPVR